MNNINYLVEPCERNEIKDFIELYHYSKSINGIKSSFCFKLLDNTKIIGASIFGRLAMFNQYKKYTDSENKIIELRRLVCIDDTKKNTESYFISKCIKWLKRNTKIELILSYADPHYNHQGIIYKASSFQYLGQGLKGKYIIYEGKKYHDKTIRTKYNGKLKPFAQRIKSALETGNAYYIQTEGKHIFLKRIRSNW